MLKKVVLISALLLGSLGPGFTATAAEDSVTNEIKDSIVLAIDSSKAYINGKPARIDNKDQSIVPIADKGNTLIPLRFVADQLGGSLTYNAKSKEITIKAGGNTARTKVGDSVLYINEKKTAMNTASKTVNGTTYLPLRAVVEDVFHKKLYAKNGIIVISNEPKTLTDSTLTKLAKELKPYLIYTGGEQLLNIYSDGTYTYQELARDDTEIINDGSNRVVDIVNGYYYLEYNNYQPNNYMIHKVSLDGSYVKTLKPNIQEYDSLQAVGGGYLYFLNPNHNITRVNENNLSDRKVIGKGYFLRDQAYIRNDQIWFTDQGDDADQAIYTIYNGKKTRITGKDCYLYYVHDNWIYYGHYENKGWVLYRITLGGGKKTKLSGNEDILESVISNNKIYYLDHRSKTVKEMNLDGSNKRVVCKLGKLGGSIFAGSKGNIYFTEEDQYLVGSSQALYKVNTATGAKKQLVNIDLDFSSYWRRILNVQELGDNVYYTVYSKVYRVKNDGTGLKPIDHYLDGYRDPVGLRIN
ncbi:stalk domain-containing protein [Paenibacillus sp. CAA11]|uniref:stalk domain-containing protein n=1 Tax=Paenibacillus sp. CAA11 TaxID=1532905 RepID=UPI00131EDD03|nr:DUF5050 domain-containing protein [Paenibacillus sp. CAA11]